MPNMSNKNFPHAHGAGRVIAAFSLSHPGASAWNEASPHAPTARDLQVLPPVLADTSLGATYPYPDATAAGLDLQWGIYRQPHNATSVGVYVQGSGTRRLPYTESILPEVPAFVSPSLNEVLPTTEPYPFELVDKTELGSSHAQVVCSAVGTGEQCPGLPAEFDGAGEMAYYEIGLNWSIPDLRIVIEPGTGYTQNNWANKQIASVQRSLERTFWATASVQASALSEWHPAVDYGDNINFVNAEWGPVDGNLTAPTAPLGLPDPAWGGMMAPYCPAPLQGEQASSDVQPAFWPQNGGYENLYKTRPFGVQTQVCALVTSVEQQIIGGTELERVYRFAPIVRVWVLLPSREIAAVPPGTPTWGARPIPRTVMTPFRTEAGDDVSFIPAVNVQVVQKNTSAVDGTDGPIYDLGVNWQDLGVPASAPVTRRKPSPRMPAPPDPKKPEIT